MWEGMVKKGKVEEGRKTEVKVRGRRKGKAGYGNGG